MVPVSGTASLIGMSVPPESTVVARPLNGTGQQVPELWATVGLTMSRDVPDATLTIYLATAQGERCLGASPPAFSFSANVQVIKKTPSVKSVATGPPGVCPLPYTTTRVEVHVSDEVGTQVFEEWFPATYYFVAP